MLMGSRRQLDAVNGLAFQVRGVATECEGVEYFLAISGGVTRRRSSAAITVVVVGSVVGHSGDPRPLLRPKMTTERSSRVWKPTLTVAAVSVAVDFGVDDVIGDIHLLAVDEWRASRKLQSCARYRAWTPDHARGLWGAMRSGAGSTSLFLRR